MSYTGGEFGAMLQVHIQNDGPVTLQFETPNIPPGKEVCSIQHSILQCVTLNFIGHQSALIEIIDIVFLQISLLSSEKAQ